MMDEINNDVDLENARRQIAIRRGGLKISDETIDRVGAMISKVLELHDGETISRTRLKTLVDEQVRKEFFENQRDAAFDQAMWEMTILSKIACETKEVTCESYCIPEKVV